MLASTLSLAMQPASSSREGSSCSASSSGRPAAPIQARPCGRLATRSRSRLVPVRASAADAAAELVDLLTPETTPTRILSSEEVIEALYSSQHARQQQSYAAMYSSELGGVVTDPALMVVQMDDHMVHRGHAVFDTAILVDGHLYQLPQHLQRFLTSAAKASIPLPEGMSVEQLYRTILETAAASKLTNGYLRYWLSAGRGGFGLSADECPSSAFYCMVLRSADKSEEEATEHLRGWRVKTSPVPLKAPFFATLKSTNYLPNALAVMDAQAEGFHQGIFVDPEGFVCEGPNMNVAALLADGTLVVPPFTRSLAGVTIQRIMELVPPAIAEGMDGVARVEQRPLSLGEAKAAAEVFVCGGSLPVMPVVQWDDVLIGDGTPGIVSLYIRALIERDQKPGPKSDQHVPVPYGYLTGMGW